MPPLGVGESLTARRLTASHLADETNPLDSVSIGLTVEFGVSLSHPSIFSVRRATRPSRRCGPHPPANTIELSLLSSNLFPPPGEAYPSDVLSLTISHRMLPEPPQFRVSLLPTRRRDYPSGSVEPSVWALVSCHDVDAGLPVSSYACRPHATLIHSMPWVSISRRMLWEPPCWASQTLFICLADRTHPSVGGVLCPIGGFMGPLGQIPPSVLWLAGADGQ